MSPDSYVVVRPEYCGHYTENIRFGPFDTREEAQEFSRKAGLFGRQDAIVTSRDYNRSRA